MDSHLCPEIFCQRMNDALPDGIMLLKAVEVGESLPSLMSLIDRAGVFNNCTQSAKGYRYKN